MEPFDYDLAEAPKCPPGCCGSVTVRRNDVPTPATIPGVPRGLPEAVLSILRESAGPVRRRPLLAELERRGHRVSLAGLNRVLESCLRSGLTIESPDGIRPKS